MIKWDGQIEIVKMDGEMILIDSKEKYNEYYEYLQEKQIKSYSYNLTYDGILEIFITDINGNEFIIATICDCGNMKDYELDNLALETIEQMDYIFI